MAKDDRVHPVALARDLALVLQRLASEGADRPEYAPGERARLVARAAVRGIAEEVEERFLAPESGLARLLGELDKLVERLVQEGSPGTREPGERARLLGRAVVRGAQEQLRASLGGPSDTYQAFLNRLGAWLEWAAKDASARASQIREPGDRARIAAAGFVRGALTQAGEMAPQLEDALEKLEPAVERLADRVGAGLARGLVERGEDAVRLADAVAERAGRSLVRGVHAQATSVWPDFPGVGPAMSEASRRLGARLSRWFQGAEWRSAARWLGGEATAGALATVSSRYKRPAMAMGAAAALLALTVGLTRGLRT